MGSTLNTSFLTLPVRFAQDPFENLTRGGTGKFIHDLHRAGTFIPGQVGRAMGQDIFGCNGIAVFQDHQGLDLFTEIGVRNTDDGDLGDLGNLGDHLLDFGRIDILPAADDHVVLAVGQVVIAFLVEIGHIAGGGPFTVNGFGGFFRRVVISDEGRAGLGPQHALGVRCGDDVAGIIDQFDFDSRVGLTDTAHLAHLVLVAQGGQRTGLGGAVAFTETDVIEKFQGRFLGRGQQRRRGTTQGGQRAHVVLLLDILGKIQDAGDHGRDHGAGGHLLMVDDLENLFRIEPARGEDHVRSAAPQGDQGRPDTVGVADGNDGQKDALVQLDMRLAGRADENVFDDIQGAAGGVHGTFGKSRGSGGISEVEDIVFFLLHVVRFAGRLAGQEILVMGDARRCLVLGADDEDMLLFHLGDVFQADFIKQLLAHEKYFGIGVVDHILEFGRHQAEVDRHGNHRRPGQAMVDLEKFDVVVHDNRAFGLPFEPEPKDGVGQLIGTVVQFGIRHPPVLENGRHLVRIPP
ncbi:hypothetical protein DESC_190109 [Desulfosarcina cetonica]|nr:hypothetical protein DESC_190109 [Desulfosarcina cetonica]